MKPGDRLIWNPLLLGGGEYPVVIDKPGEVFVIVKKDHGEGRIFPGARPYMARPEELRKHEGTAS